MDWVILIGGIMQCSAASIRYLMVPLWWDLFYALVGATVTTYGLEGIGIPLPPWAALFAPVALAGMLYVMRRPQRIR